MNDTSSSATEAKAADHAAAKLCAEGWAHRDAHKPFTVADFSAGNLARCYLAYAAALSRDSGEAVKRARRWQRGTESFGSADVAAMAADVLALSADLSAAKAEGVRMRTALEWYANSAHYDESSAPFDPVAGEPASYLLNEGERAREALRLPGASKPVVTRDDRQRQVAAWCAAAFGTDHANSIPQRGVRMLEEAIEAYQAAGGTDEMAQRLVTYIFERPAGTLAQELGAVGLTLLALAAAANESADDTEAAELARVLAKPLAHFADRNETKNAAGFNVCGKAIPGASKPEEGQTK